MTRENSSFNMRNVLTKCCHRQAALFTVSLLSLIVTLPITMILMIQSYLRYNWDNTEPEMRSLLREYIQENLFSQAFASVALIALAIVAGISLFRYLHVRSQVDFFHALPLKRKQIFLLRMGTGLLAVIPAYLISVALTCGVCAAYGYADAINVKMLAVSIFVHLVGFLLVYAFSILAAVLCGHTLVSLLLCGWLQFGLLLGVFVFTQLLDILYPARVVGGRGYLLWLSPLTAIYRIINPLDRWTDGQQMDVMGECILPSIIILVVTAVILLLSYVLFCHRKSEYSGISIAFPKLELPLRLYMVTVLGVSCGLIFEITTGSWSIMFLGIVLGGLVTACVTEIIYDLDFHSLFHRWKSLVIYGVICAVVLGAMAMDLTHWNSKLPNRADVVGVDLISNTDEWNCSDASRNIARAYESFGVVSLDRTVDEDKANTMLTSQEAINAIYNSAQLGSQAMKGDRSKVVNGYDYTVSLQLTNGKIFERKYYLPSDTKQMIENSAAVRFSQEYMNTRMTISQVEKQKNQIVHIMAGGYRDVTMGTASRIADRVKIIKLLETLQAESMHLTKEYTAEHAPVVMLRAFTEKEWRQISEENLVDWESYSEYDYYIPVYASQTETLQLLGKYAPELQTGFGSVKDIARITVQEETGTTVYSEPSQIQNKLVHLLPPVFAHVKDPGYKTEYTDVTVELKDGTDIHCMEHVEE